VSFAEAPLAAPLNPTGFPRIPPVSQFDGGPFQGANCTLASGAMLARLGWGIVTTGSILRTLQDDFIGGTGLDDLGTALWRGYGVAPKRGLLTPTQLKELLAGGYGAVIQGVYGEIPEPLRLQKNFTGPHAIYVDGYYPGDATTPPAYYVIDPIGRPASGYQGGWWPASIVDAFTAAMGYNGNRVAASWVFPPGGVPPQIGVIDVPEIPPSGGDTPAGSNQPSVPPSLEPGVTEPPVVAVPPEPGNVGTVVPAGGGGLEDAGTIGGIELIPQLLICLVEEPPPGCPSGIEGVYEIPSAPEVGLAPGPSIDVRYVDSSRPNVVLVSFTVEPVEPADVRFWEADGSPATIGTATSLTAVDILGTPTIIARLDVLASKTYHFQVVAGGGLLKSSSEVGTFTTGIGAARMEVVLGSVAEPVFGLGEGLSPYVHLAIDAVVPPLEPCLDIRAGLCQVVAGSFDAASAVACAGIAGFGETTFCLRRLEPLDGPPIGTCQQATVTYELTGIDETGVLVQAFPTEPGVLPDGAPTLAGILEASGPAGSGSVSVGCLASGMSYVIVLDAVGDDRGILASREIVVP
jgi:hypothetical protein